MLTRERAIEKIREFLINKIENEESFKNLNLKLIMRLLEEIVAGEIPVTNSEEIFDILMIEEIDSLPKDRPFYSRDCVTKLYPLFSDKEPFV